MSKGRSCQGDGPGLLKKSGGKVRRKSPEGILYQNYCKLIVPKLLQVNSAWFIKLSFCCHLSVAMALSDKKRRMYKKKKRVYKKRRRVYKEEEGVQRRGGCTKKRRVYKEEEGVQRRGGCTKIGLLQAKAAGILNFVNKLVVIILNRPHYVTCLLIA
jgi:hypothetical protein